MKTTYKNRYGDIFTFTLQEDGNVLWQGNFEYCRFGMPNDYTKAYNQYVNDNKHVQSLMSFNQFKDVVHEYDDETHQYIYDKYVRMVESIKDKISMIDPSGGPYISVEMPLSSFGFKDLKVKDFETKENGYLIITEKV
jgi:hypothetical protein